jgi:hypothetical protein
MLASKLLASSALALAFWSSAALADETVKPAAKGNVVVTPEVHIAGRRQVPSVTVDVARLVPRAPLPALRQPLIDRIGKAVDDAPFSSSVRRALEGASRPNDPG